MNLQERVERLEQAVGVQTDSTSAFLEAITEDEPDRPDPVSLRLDAYRESTRKRVHELLAQAQSQAERQHEGTALLAAERVQAYENVLRFL